MVSVMSLWLPILVSAVFVFIASSIIHMVLGYHKNDMRGLPKEDEVMAALRPFAIPPGDYGMPHATSMEAMKSPAFAEKMKNGPVVYNMTVVPNGPPSMGSSMVLWFLYCLVVSALVGFVTGHVGGGDHFRRIFRFAGCTAFASYSMALLPFSIWYKRNWGTTILGMFDGLIYALVTAATFGWLWPR